MSCNFLVSVGTTNNVNTRFNNEVVWFTVLTRVLLRYARNSLEESNCYQFFIAHFSEGNKEKSTKRQSVNWNTSALYQTNIFSF